MGSATSLYWSIISSELIPKRVFAEAVALGLTAGRTVERKRKPRRFLSSSRNKPEASVCVWLGKPSHKERYGVFLYINIFSNRAIVSIPASTIGGNYQVYDLRLGPDENICVPVMVLSNNNRRDGRMADWPLWRKAASKARRFVRFAPKERRLRYLTESLRYLMTKYEIERLLVTLPRSGYNYLKTVLNVAKDRSNGGSGDYWYEDRVWKCAIELFTEFDFRTATKATFGELTGQEAIYHTHRFRRLFLYDELKSLDKVILIRNPLDQLESVLHKRGYGPETVDEFFSSGLVENTITFLNGWGRHQERHGDLLVVRYEEIMSEPSAGFQHLNEYWSLGLNTVSIHEAIDSCTKEAMFEKIPAGRREGNERVSRREERVIEGSVRLRLEKYLEANLEYRFGYDFG